MTSAFLLRAGATVLLALALACPASAKPKKNQELEAAGVPALDEPGAANEEAEALMKELSRAQPGQGNNQFCAIIITSDGQLAASPEANELSSMTFGGRPGQAEIIATNSSYTLSIDAPLGFSLAPAGGNDSMLIRTSYSGFGATSFSATPGNVPIRLKRGSTTVSANMVATKTSSLFPAGQYRAELTLRCE
jgi:hypothetical protein